MNEVNNNVTTEIEESVSENVNSETHAIEEEGVEKSNSVVVNHIMYSEKVINDLLAVLNSMTVTGAENIMKFSDIYRTLATTGQVVPVTIQ